MNTSVQPDTLELDGWDPELLAPLTADDFDTIDENGVSGVRELAAAPTPARRSLRRATPVQWSTQPRPVRGAAGPTDAAHQSPVSIVTMS